MPVKVFKSFSAVYMTCLVKLSKSAIVPKCNQKLSMEQEIVEAIDKSIMPKASTKRQPKSKELLLRLNNDFNKIFTEGKALWDNTATEKSRMPKALSEINLETTELLLNAKKNFYEIFTKGKVLWNDKKKLWVNTEGEGCPLSTSKVVQYVHYCKSHCSKKLKKWSTRAYNVNRKSYIVN